MKKTLGIIGYGNFGEYIEKILKKYFKVIIYLRESQKNVSTEVVFEADINTFCETCDIIIIASPMRYFENTLHLIKDKLHKEQLIIDVCSLKIFTCDLMKKILPKYVNIVGTHPLFGPNSKPEILRNKKIVLCKVNGERINSVKRFCEKLKLNVIITTPKKHDLEMAKTQALTFFVTEILNNIHFNNSNLSTPSSKLLEETVKSVRKDSNILFFDLQNLNPYSKTIREKFIKAAEKYDKKLS